MMRSLLCYILCFAGVAGYCQQGQLSISGTVFDRHGRTMREVQFEVYRSDSTLVVDTICGRMGDFRIVVDYDHLYFVIVSKFGFLDKTFQINSAGLYGNEKLEDQEVADVKIELRPGRSDVFTEPTGIILLNYYTRRFEARMVKRPEQDD